MIPQGSYRLLDTFATHSERLAQDALGIFTKACKPADERDCAGHDVTDERLKDLLIYIDLLKQSSAETFIHLFIDKGFNLLKKEVEWAKVEQELYMTELEKPHTRRGGSVRSGLNNLAKAHFDDQELCSPGFVPSMKGVIDISPMYVYPINWIIDFKKLATEMLATPKGYTKNKSTILTLLRAFFASRYDSYIIQFLADNKTFGDAIDDDQVFEILVSKTSRNNHSRLHKARSIHNPDLHGAEAKHAPRGKHYLVAGAKSKGAYWVHELSPNWLKQCQKYVDGIYQKHGEREALSTITRLTKVSSAMIDHKDSLPNLELLKKTDMSSFFENKQELIKALYEIDDNRLSDTRGEILAMHNALYGTNWIVPNLMDFTIQFNCDSGDGRYRYIILDNLAKKFTTLTQQIADYAHYELRRIDGNKKAEETVFSRVSIVHTVFNNHLDALNKDDLELLAEHGVDALKLNNCHIIKRIRYTLKQKFESDKLARGTVKQTQYGFRHFCLHFNLPDVYSYALSARKRKLHELKNKASDYYAVEDVATIAYTIELGLRNTHLTKHDELLLRLAKVLVKTGWNLSPVLMLEIDDILKVDAPITGKAMHFVRLFKKRAGYKTQFYEFGMDAESIENEGLVFGDPVTNALADLEYIRDKISHELRGHLPSSSILEYRLSLYRDNDGGIRGLSHKDFNYKLNEVLIRYGCNVRFNTQRIRKGGLNYVYKKFAKDFKEYKKAAQHSLKTFLEVYLRNDGLKSEETLASATSIMSEYFSGRPITDDIIIVTQIPADTKQTPTGRCASKGNDAESDAFSKKHQRLNRDFGTAGTQCGDFNACLFCRHFRLVADAEHVWRLLSYHRYVLGDMERGVSDYDSTTDQATYIAILNERVDELLDQLSEINSDAVITGRQLMESKGCHQDWLFFADIGAVQ